MESVLATGKPLLILDTNAFWHLFQIRIDDESALLKIVNIYETYIPIHVKEEIEEDIKSKKFEFLEDHEREVRQILKIVGSKDFREMEEECLKILKSSVIEFRGISKPADKECISLSLQLSRHKEYKYATIFLVTDEKKLLEIANRIFNEQLIGSIFSSYKILIYLSVRGVLLISHSKLVDILRFMKNFYEESLQKELDEVIKKKFCPYSCDYYIKSKCPFICNFKTL